MTAAQKPGSPAPQGLDVFLTVDVEIWCGGWRDLDARFPQAYRSYVQGSTDRGDYGLPYHLREFGDHGLEAVFFVEPLFAMRFGLAPLQEIVGMIRSAGQEVQMHLHTEWVDEARDSLFPGNRAKRQFLHQFSLAEQQVLVAEGRRLLAAVGCDAIDAFRAGSFGFNRDTLKALAQGGVKFDSSYNATMGGRDSGVLPGTVVTEPIVLDGVTEVPMTVFRDGTGALRHAQLGACSAEELEGLLWRALESGRRAFVLLSHNFEVLNAAKTRPDMVVVRRMRRLLRFLDRHRDCFRVRGFRGLEPNPAAVQPEPLESPIWRTGGRILEQAIRRVVS